MAYWPGLGKAEFPFSKPILIDKVGQERGRGNEGGGKEGERSRVGDRERE